MSAPTLSTDEQRLHSLTEDFDRRYGEHWSLDQLPDNERRRYEFLRDKVCLQKELSRPDSPLNSLMNDAETPERRPPMTDSTNPLIGVHWSDTVRSCATALELLTALDLERLTDRARNEGLDTILMPVIDALDAVSEDGEDTINLNRDTSLRLRAFAEAHHRGHITEAAEALIQAGEEAAQKRAAEAADPERLRPSWVRLRAFADDELRKLDEALDEESIRQEPEADLTTYTVILLYPESMNATGTETYTWAGPAGSPEQAIEQARTKACQDNDYDPVCDRLFPLISVLEGSARFCDVAETLHA